MPPTVTRTYPRRRDSRAAADLVLAGLSALPAPCRRKLCDSSWAWAEPQLASMGERAALEVAPLAAIADRNQPRLVTHDERGQRIDRVDYHPAYRDMERVAYGSGMIAMKYPPADAGSTFVSFALGYLFAMAEMGLYCPLCMTDGVARVVVGPGTRDQIDRLVPRLASRETDALWTGAMFLTERAGGSDVGSNETIARRDADGTWRLTGQKWFCSNVPVWKSSSFSSSSAGLSSWSTPSSIINHQFASIILAACTGGCSATIATSGSSTPLH